MKRTWLCLLALASLSATSRSFCQYSNSPVYSELIPSSSGLPYDPDRDHREMFEAPNGKTVEALVKGPVGSGTYSRPIHPGETADTYFPSVVNEAVAAGVHHLVIPKGVYAFRGPELCTDLTSSPCNLPTSCNANQYWNCAPHWTIGQYPSGPVKEPDSIRDLDIDFSGSELDFSAPGIGIWILEAERLRLRNFTIDWPSLPIASLGTIVRDPDNPGHNALVLDPRYPVQDQYQGGPVQIQAVDIWDDSRDDPPGYFDARSNNNFEVYFIFGNAPQPTYVGKTSAGEHTFSCKSCHFENSASDPSCSFFSGCANFDIFAPGTRVVVRHYTYNGFAVIVNWSNDIDFENVKLRTGPGIGISVSSNGGYRGFRLAGSEIARGPGRLISTASDAIDISQKADIIIKGNNIGYQGDDSLSIYPTTSAITSVKAAQIDIPAVCDPDPMDEPEAGDTLAFFDTNFIYKATARVVAAEGAFCAPTLRLRLDHAIPGLNSTDQILDLTQQGSARYVVRENAMHECRCHGVLVDAPYGSIDHNLMYRNSAGAIQLAGGNSFGPGSTNLTISSNRIALSGQSTQYYGAITLLATDINGNIVPSHAFEKIKIDHNVFEATPGPAVVATSTSDLLMRGNRILDSNQVQTEPIDFGTIPSLDSVVIYESSHATICGTQREGRTTGPIGVDSTAASVLVETDCQENDRW